MYEATDRANVVAPANLVGDATANPFDHAPAPPDLLFYQLDDGVPPAGDPTIRMVEGGRGLLIHY